MDTSKKERQILSPKITRVEFAAKGITGMIEITLDSYASADAKNVSNVLIKQFEYALDVSRPFIDINFKCKTEV